MEMKRRHNNNNSKSWCYAALHGILLY